MSGTFAIRFSIDDAQWPSLEELLDELGALSVTQSEGDRELFAEPGVPADAQWSCFTIEALFDGSCARDAVLIAVRAQLPRDSRLEVHDVADEDWAERWKSSWQPLEFGGGLCVCPSWCEPPATARHVIRIDPGQAFGTGTHETTALCLDWLAAAPLGGLDVADYGCGSGVLALAAQALGARRVYAVDIDADAIATARDNVAANGAGGVVTVGPPDLLAGRVVDLLVANILLEPLLALAPRIAALVRPGGYLALSGLLTRQAETARQAYDDDFSFAATVNRGDWSLLAARRRG